VQQIVVAELRYAVVRNGGNRREARLTLRLRFNQPMKGPGDVFVFSGTQLRRQPLPVPIRARHRYVAIITDPRDDEPLGRRHRDIGTRIVVPKNKIKWNEGNPVGHGIIFLNRADSVFCYLPPLGI
jgi:hypothetical protein